MNEPVILAFDTSAAVFTAALYAGGTVREASFESGARHADAVFADLARFLKKNRLTAGEADVIAAGVGPGSFTGIRVGVSAAKALAYASGRKLMGFSTLRILAENWKAPAATICVVQDAGRRNVYAAAFSGPETVRPPRLLSEQDFLEDADPSFAYLGTALARSGLRQALEARAGRGRVNASSAIAAPRAARIVPLALERWRRGEFDDPLRLAPDYLYDRACNIAPKLKEEGLNGIRTEAR